MHKKLSMESIITLLQGGKIGTKFDLDVISKVADPIYKNFLIDRLSENGNDPKKLCGKNTLSKIRFI